MKFFDIIDELTLDGTYESIQYLMKLRHDIAVMNLLDQGFTLPDVNMMPHPDLIKDGIHYDITFSSNPDIIREKEEKGFTVINGWNIDLNQESSVLVNKINDYLSKYTLENVQLNTSFLLPMSDQEYSHDFPNKLPNFDKEMVKVDIPSLKSVVKYLNSNRGNVIIGDCKDLNQIIFGDDQSRCLEDNNFLSDLVPKNNYYILKDMKSIRFIDGLPKKMNSVKKIDGKQISCMIKVYPSVQDILDHFSKKSNFCFKQFSTSYKDYGNIEQNLIMRNIQIFSSICEDLLFMSSQKIKANSFVIRVNRLTGIKIIMSSGPPLTRKGATRFYRLIYVDMYNHLTLSGWRSIKSCNLNYYIGLYRSIMSHNLIFRDRENDCNEYLLIHNLLAYTKNPTFNDMLLSLRYIHMNKLSHVDKSNLLIKEKWDKVFRYNYMGHLLHKILINVNRHSYKITDKSLVMDNLSVKIDTESILNFKVTSLITGSYFNNPKSLINEMYIGYYNEINPENKLSSIVKVVNKVSKMLYKEQLSNMASEDLHDSTETYDWYRYDESVISTMCKEYVKSLNITRGMFNEKLSKTRFNKNIIQLAALTGSCDFSDPMSRKSPTSYESMIDLINYYKSTDPFTVAEQIVNSDFEYNMRIASKVQHGGERELMVQDPRTKICNAVADSIFEALCSFDPNEMLTKQDNKIYEQMNMIIPETETEMIYDNGDNSSWGPNMIPKSFISMLPSLKPIIGDRLCIFLHKHFTKMSNKNLIKPLSYDDTIYDKDHLPDHYLSTMYGKNSIKQSGNMGQGILHYTSSFWHGCAIYTIDKKVSEIDEVVRVKTIYSSDDYLRSVCHAKNIDKKYLCNKIENITLVINRYFNIIKNIYKSTYSSVINEFNSQFAIGQGFLIPDSVFLIPIFQYEPCKDTADVIMKFFQKVRTYANKTVTLNDTDIVLRMGAMHLSILGLDINVDPLLIKFLGMDKVSFINKALLKPLRHLDILRKNKWETNKSLILPTRAYDSSISHGINAIFNSTKGHELIDRSFSVLKMIINSKKDQPDAKLIELSYPNQKLFDYIKDFSRSIIIDDIKPMRVKNYYPCKILSSSFKFKNSVETLFCIKNKIEFDDRFITNSSTLKHECFMLDGDLDKMRIDHELYMSSLPISYTVGKKKGTLIDILRENISSNLISNKRIIFRSLDIDYTDSSLINLNKKCFNVLSESTFLSVVENSVKRGVDHIRKFFEDLDIEKTCIKNIANYKNIKKMWDIMSTIDLRYHELYKNSPISYRFKKNQTFKDGKYDIESDCVIIAKSQFSQIEIKMTSGYVSCKAYSINVVDSKNLFKTVLTHTLNKSQQMKLKHHPLGNINLFPDIEPGTQFHFEMVASRLFFEELIHPIESINFSYDDQDLAIASVQKGIIRFGGALKCPDNYNHPLNKDYLDVNDLKTMIEFYFNPENVEFKDLSNLNDKLNNLEEEFDFDNLDMGFEIEMSENMDTAPVDIIQTKRVNNLKKKLNAMVFQKYLDLCRNECSTYYCISAPEINKVIDSDMQLEHKMVVVHDYITSRYEVTTNDFVEMMDFDEMLVINLYNNNVENDLEDEFNFEDEFD